MEELYDRLQASINKVNAQLAGHQELLSFENSTVLIGSALEGWAVSLDACLALCRAAARIAPLCSEHAPFLLLARTQISARLSTSTSFAAS